MPTRIELTPRALIVHVEGADRLWALRSRLEIPLEHVAGAASATVEARKWFHGLRVGGTEIPPGHLGGAILFPGQTGVLGCARSREGDRDRVAR